MIVLLRWPLLRTRIRVNDAAEGSGVGIKRYVIPEIFNRGSMGSVEGNK
jgi:hypothetical protein